ncbi:peptidoglycan-binding protein [Microvirga sp. W0021]|uniref:Peptidoglycan-binding protein n=1 Tax=Hohaiivirga grylli TaxID=3133970 RepID=A0ABV0BI98_9HYPH
MRSVRNAYYQPEYDDMYAPPKRNPTPRRKAAAGKRLLGMLAKNPQKVFTGALFLGITAVVSVNALVMQTSRHPAPMFSPIPVAAPVPTPRPVAQAVPAQEASVASTVEGNNNQTANVSPVSVPVPVARTETQSRDEIGDIIRTGSTAPQPAASVPAPAPRAAVAPQPPARRDAIADLIRSNGNASAAASPGEMDAQKRKVMAGQQALNKLGYGPLTTDGVMGSGTKKAIERFEFDKRLPVTGTLNSQTVSELASLSKLPIR